MSTVQMQSFMCESERLKYRGLCEEDIEGPYLNWFNDQEVCRHNSHGRFPSTREKMLAYIRMLQTSEDHLVWAVIEKESGLHVGNVALQSINMINRAAEFAIIMGDKERWGRGYALEAAKTIIRHGFAKLGLNRVYCGTSENNNGMLRLAGRLEMKQEGVRREAFFENAEFVDVIEFGLLRREFVSDIEK